MLLAVIPYSILVPFVGNKGFLLNLVLYLTVGFAIAFAFYRHDQISYLQKEQSSLSKFSRMLYLKSISIQKSIQTDSNNGNKLLKRLFRPIFTPLKVLALSLKWLFTND